ncbi:MAG: hypothetical protein ACR2LX_14085 [Jatrophihabitans sp.]
MTQPLPPYQPSDEPVRPTRRGLPRWGKGLAVGAAALVLAGAFVGVGMAVGTDGSSGNMAGMSPSTSASAPAHHRKTGKHAKKDKGQKTKGTKGGTQATADPARQAWAHKYGVDRDTMPNLAPVSGATAQQQAGATTLLKATEAATTKYSNLATAKAAGYDLQASLAQKEKKSPGTAQRLKDIDAGKMPTGGKMPMLHVGNKALKTDGKVLDPNAPETLMYSYTGHGNWKLIGVMYTANESYPKAPPDPGGPITRWHYHPKSGGAKLMMHVFFVSDLAHAYAAEMS